MCSLIYDIKMLWLLCGYILRIVTHSPVPFIQLIREMSVHHSFTFILFHLALKRNSLNSKNFCAKRNIILLCLLLSCDKVELQPSNRLNKNISVPVNQKEAKVELKQSITYHLHWGFVTKFIEICMYCAFWTVCQLYNQNSV